MQEELLQSLLLAQLGHRALSNEEAADPPELGKFNDAIAQYSLNRSASWGVVLELAVAVAARRIDLKVYGYLALAAFNSEKELEDGEPYQQLGAALCALSDVITHGWERCTPRIPARRQALLRWLSEELVEPVKARAPKPREAQQFLTCQRVCEQLAVTAGTAMGFDYPLLRELRDALGGHRAGVDEVLAKQAAAQLATAAAAAPTVPKERATPVESEVSTVSSAVKSESKSEPAVTAAVPAQLQTQSESPRESLPPLGEMSQDGLVDHLTGIVSRLTASMREEAPFGPSAVWLVRALCWASHDLLTPERAAEVLANKCKTVLPLPQGYKSLSKQLPLRLQQGQHAEVFAECEELLTSYPLWLDLQRFSAQALESLGADAAMARTVLRSEVVLLLERCPEVVQFRFADRDATPFADAETQAWLASERTHKGAAQTSSGESPSHSEVLPEGLSPAVNHLQRQLGIASSGRQRFELRLRLAELLLRHQRSDIALPILSELLSLAESHGLREWQPELLAKVLRFSVEAARAAELANSERTQLWEKLCRISPGDSLLLGPESS
jgi:type VI secretion system protein VasJ